MDETNIPTPEVEPNRGKSFVFQNFLDFLKYKVGISTAVGGVYGASTGYLVGEMTGNKDNEIYARMS